jgi:hypothetical protein
MATQYTAGLTTGQVLTAATMNSIGAAWESYTPTWTQSGAITKTVTYAKYTRINKLVIASVSMVATGAGTGNNAIIVGLPLSAAQTTNLPIGSGFIYDASTNTIYNGTVQAISATTAQMYYQTGNAIGVSPNFAIASSDQIQIFVMYEAA